MYCPNCAAKNSTEQNYCRSCGLELEVIKNSLLEQLDKSESISAIKISRFFEILGKMGFGGLIGSGLVAIIFLLGVIFNKFILSGQTDKILIGIVFFTLISSAVLGLAYVIFQEYLKQSKNKVNLKKTIEIEGNETKRLLEEKLYEPFVTVTEETTDLLLVSAKRKTSGDLI